MDTPKRTGTWLGLGLLTAIGASLCCAGPLLLLLAGVSGAWISHLSALNPYQPWLLGATAATVLLAGYSLFRHPKCEADKPCASTQIRRRRQWLFVASAFIILIIASSSWWLALIVEV